MILIARRNFGGKFAIPIVIVRARARLNTISKSLEVCPKLLEGVRGIDIGAKLFPRVSFGVFE